MRSVFRGACQVAHAAAARASELEDGSCVCGHMHEKRGIEPARVSGYGHERPACLATIGMARNPGTWPRDDENVNERSVRLEQPEEAVVSIALVSCPASRAGDD